MRTKISALVLLSVLSLLCKVESQNQFNCDTLSIIRQYFECQYLEMYLSSSDWVPYYVRNESIPNNQLDDSFYKSKGLDKMTFDQGMDLIRQIYLDTQDNSYLSNCTSKGFIVFCNSANLFRNASNFAGMKTIIAAFNRKYESSLKSLNDSLSVYSNGQAYPSIVKFLMTNEYTGRKLAFYNRKFDCFANDYNENVRNYLQSNLYFTNRYFANFLFYEQNIPVPILLHTNTCMTHSNLRNLYFTKFYFTNTVSQYI